LSDDALPEFLADRDLGKRVVEVLRAAGAVVHTLPEVFGEESAQLAADTEWIAAAGQYGWVALSKNKRIRYVTAEREALAEHGVPLFALVNGSMDLKAMAKAFLAALPRILELCESHLGGSVWIVHRDGRVERQWP
jgi:hypothetical protein